MATYNTCGWSYQYSQYGNTMTSTTKVMIGGAAEDGGALGAFVGDECRGIQSTVSKPPFGPNAFKPMYQMTVGGNAGETITYKFCKGGIEYTTDATDTFVINANLGNVIFPEVNTFVAPPPTAPASCSDWTFDHTEYENSMSATFNVGNFWGVPGTLAAFVGDKMIGLQTTTSQPPFGPHAGKQMYQIMMYGNGSGDTITYKYCWAGVAYPSTRTDTFTVNGNLGNVLFPEHVTF